MGWPWASSRTGPQGCAGEGTAGVQGWGWAPKLLPCHGVVMAKGPAQPLLRAPDGLKHRHIHHQSHSFWSSNCPAPSPPGRAVGPARPQRSRSPRSCSTRCGPQPCFGSSLVRSLDAQQSISPSWILSPSTQLIGGGAALLPAPRSRSVPAAGVVSTTVCQISLPAPPAARSP